MPPARNQRWAGRRSSSGRGPGFLRGVEAPPRSERGLVFLELREEEDVDVEDVGE